MSHKSKLYPNEMLYVLKMHERMGIIDCFLIHAHIEEYCESTRRVPTDPEIADIQSFFLHVYVRYACANIPEKDQMNISTDESMRVIDNSGYYDICDTDGFLPDEFHHIQYDQSTKNKCLNSMEKKVYGMLFGKITGKVCVSLSGGVDSMVLVYILKQLEQKLGIDVSAFHISYNNRVESQYEKYLIWNYCKKLNVLLYNYDVKFVKRGNIKRDLYEKTTRDMRFKCYRKIATPIVLGHIREDGIENILTNLSTNQHMFNLVKMHVIDIVDDVKILRPFIQSEKDDIFGYAYKNNIPYLNNTTPSWSNRGRFRRSFMPAYMSQYGENSLQNLETFAHALENYGEIITNSIIIPNVGKLLNGDSVILAPELCNNIHILREIFKRICYAKQYRCPSVKNIRDFIQTSQKKSKFIYQLGNDLKLKMCNKTLSICGIINHGSLGV
tara:strand:+ start:356 stop:1678 length:1323 start_codon:yes stop_codon:yes gene_type:complete